MKIYYDNEDVILDLIRIGKERPDLFARFDLVKRKLEAMDFDDLSLHIEEELVKSNASKEVKELPGECCYEYRIPPHNKDGVLRMKFAIEDDYYSIRVSRIWIKDARPKGAIRSKKKT